MLGASMIFALLSQFYYEYVPEGLFLEAEKEAEKEAEMEAVDDDAEKGSLGVENAALEDEEHTEAEL